VRDAGLGSREGGNYIIGKFCERGSLGRAKGGPMKNKRRIATLVLAALVVLLVLAVVGCNGTSTTTPGSMMNGAGSGGTNPTSGGTVYGTAVGTMMGSSTSVSMMGADTTAP
jgi:hypothetical protein